MLTFTIIESPLAGDVEGNLTYVRAAMADCFARGEIPLASHALYTQPGVLDDTKPEERAKGMEAGFALREVLGCVCGDHAKVQTAVYTDKGITPGMERGIARSKDDFVPVVYRALDAEPGKGGTE